MMKVNWEPLKKTVSRQSMALKTMDKITAIRTVLADLRKQSKIDRENGIKTTRPTFGRAKMMYHAEIKKEVWANNIVFVTVDRSNLSPVKDAQLHRNTYGDEISFPTDWYNNYVYISFHHHNKLTDVDANIGWQIRQWIKNEICGEEFEAVELYQNENRMVNEANECHMYCYPTNIPIGQFRSQRFVQDSHDGGYGKGSRQDLQVRETDTLENVLKPKTRK